MPSAQAAHHQWTSNRGTLTVTTAAVLIGLYGLYALVVTPLVDAPQVRQAVRPSTLPPPPPPPENVRMATQHLPAEDWTTEAAYQLRSGGAFVYANEWQPVDDDRAIRFRPFALVWRTAEGEEPITIVSESAYVKFAGKFDFTNPDPGRVIGGALQGEVRITGPDGLLIAGRNFEFSEDAVRVWSDHQLQFEYGPHHGHAIGMQIELTKAEIPQTESSLAIDGIKSVRLRRNVSLDLQFGGNDDTPSTATPLKSDEPVRVRILSAGSFEFAMASHLATFEENVRVYRPTGPSTFDSLQCDALTLLFEEAEPATPMMTAAPRGGALVETNLTQPADSADSAGSKPDGEMPLRGLPRNLTFRRLRAHGRNVVLVSEANQLTAYLTELIYDAQSKVAALTDPEAVRVLQGPSELQSPEIRLMHDDDGRVNTAVCHGAGWIKYVDQETGVLQLDAQWVKQLRKFPDSQSEFDIIELEEQAIVRQPGEQVGLAANYIRLWIDPTDPSTAGKPSAAPESDSKSDKNSDRVRVHHMLAQDDVAMISPQLHGQTKRLEIWFENDPALTTAGRDRQALQPAVHREEALPPSSDVAPAAGPEAERNAGRARASDRLPAEPFEVVADLIRVRVLQGETPREAHVADVWTEGQVRVIQNHEPGEPPLEMSGDQLRVENRSQHDQVVHLTGNPAHIRDRGLHIEGRNVHLDRAQNIAWVDGAGLLQLPVKTTLEGEKLETPQTLDVWWKEQMRFDGKTAQFFGDVRSVLADSRMRCQEMNVRLVGALSFTEPRGAPEQKNEVERVLCKDGVEFDSYEYQQSKLMSVRRGRFSQFSLNRQTGKTEADGPGWILVWRRGNGKRAALSPEATVQANKPLKPDTADWEYTRIEFAGKTDGNINQRSTTFNDRVRVVYGPVERPLAEIDPDKLPKDAAWMNCQSLRFTQHEESDASPAYTELLARGNAEIEGQTDHGAFNARADEISFDQSKGLFILRGEGNRKATIWRQQQVGGEMGRAEAQRILFIPSKKIVKFDRATGLDGLQ